MASAGTWAAVDSSPLLAKAPLIYRYSSQWSNKAYRNQIKSYRWCRGGPRACSAWDHSGKSPLPPQGSGPAPGQNGPGVVFFNPPPQETGHSGSFGSAPPAGLWVSGFSGNWGSGNSGIEPIADLGKDDLPPPDQGGTPGPDGNPFNPPFTPPHDQGPASGPNNPSNPGPSQPGIPTPVPEPAAWMMMIAGFGVIGSALRSRRAKAGVALPAQ